MLIREVAYAGLAKLARAQYHARFAEWLAERTGEELVEIRAYHLDQAVELLTELEGAPPEELAEEAAGALVKAAKRAIAREAYTNARKLGLRALELRPTLGARYVAARAAWRLQDWAAVQVEMGKVRDQAREHGDRVIEALALTALGEATLKRDGDAEQARDARRRGARALRARGGPGRALRRAHACARPSGHGSGSRGRLRPLHGARVRDRARRAAQGPADDRRAGARLGAHRSRLELDEAELLLTRALELAGESGSVRARMSATLSYGWFLTLKGELDAAETVIEEVRATADELGTRAGGRGGAREARLDRAAPRRPQAARRSCSARPCASRAARGDRGMLPDYQAALATTLADLGKVDEAERLALEPRHMPSGRTRAARSS